MDENEKNEYKEEQEYFYNLLNTEEYESLRSIGDDYFDLETKAYYLEYDIMLSQAILLTEKNMFETEIAFLSYQYIKLLDYQDELYEKEIKTPIEQEMWIEKRGIFLSHKRDKVIQLSNNSQNYYFLTSRRIKPIQESKLLINGKRLNISERYHIANEILNVFDIINKKNISATEKHILLANIIGCSQQTARELFNGTQVKRTPIRENIINQYLDKFK